MTSRQTIGWRLTLERMLCDFGLRTIQTSLRNITHSMLDSPDDTIHEQLELIWWDGQER